MQDRKQFCSPQKLNELFGIFPSSMPCLTGNSNSKIQLEIRLKIRTRSRLCSKVEFRVRITNSSHQHSVFDRCSSDCSKLQLENLARNPAQNLDSKQALLKSRISSSYYELQSPTFGFRSLFKRLLENGETRNPDSLTAPN